MWTEENATLANALLKFVQLRQDLSYTDVPAAFVAYVRKTKSGDELDEQAIVEQIWRRLLTQYPHLFAVARARGALKTFVPAKVSSETSNASTRPSLESSTMPPPAPLKRPDPPSAPAPTLPRKRFKVARDKDTAKKTSETDGVDAAKTDA